MGRHFEAHGYAGHSCALRSRACPAVALGRSRMYDDADMTGLARGFLDGGQIAGVQEGEGARDNGQRPARIRNLFAPGLPFVRRDDL